MTCQRTVDLAGQCGLWGHSRIEGLWAQVHTPHGIVSVGDSEPQLHTLGALAAALDSDDTCSSMGITLDDVLDELARTWEPAPGGPTWTTARIARRDAARHLVAHHGMNVAAAANYCGAWAEDLPRLPERDRLDDPTGRWWITEEGNLARSYGHTELSDLCVVAHQSVQATYCLYVLPDMPHVGKETQMREMQWWTPIDAATASEVAQRWGNAPGLVAFIDDNIHSVR
ncbi:hypothetical protein AB0331_13725 [Dietzia maris]|uniref:hypothetical protein n=1 Tax=Dietzia maris TaxID=37915 RepID=UPI00344DFC97